MCDRKSGGNLTHRRTETDGRDLLLGAPCDASVGWRRRKSGDHIHQLRRRKLYTLSASIEPDRMDGELTLLASVAVHVRLQRAWSCKALVADLAFVLLL